MKKFYDDDVLFEKIKSRPHKFEEDIKKKKGKVVPYRKEKNPRREK